MRGYANNLIGQVFGSLEVIERFPHKSKEIYWNCKCKCGTIKAIRGSHLKDGSTNSCGCEKFNTNIKRLTTHSQSYTRLYHIWVNIKYRCYNQHCNHYFRYGGRGISVCKEWIESYEIFELWSLENGYTDILSLDRINNDGNYDPNNCRWATAREQGNNKSNNQYYEYDGLKLTLPEWANRYKINYGTLYKRIKEHNYSIEKALTTPVK